jgi:hypothetical protein
MELAQRIGPVARFYLNEEYIALAARAVYLRHPQGKKLVATRAEDLTDSQIAETVLKLKAWIAEQPVPVPHPDSHRARHGA